MDSNNTNKPLMGILLALCMCHLFNDALQAVVNSLYPIIKEDLSLSFMQIGLITLCYQLAASILQPLMGIYLDARPNAWFLTLAALCSLVGLVCLAFSTTLLTTIASVVLVGMGSSIVHPEASRLTSFASRGRRGLAQSIFQVGGNIGSAVGPLLAAFFIAPYGRENTAIVALIALFGVVASIPVRRWYSEILRQRRDSSNKKRKLAMPGDEDWIERPYSNRRTYFYIGVLLVLIFSKYVYMASMSSYYTFYMIEKFALTVQQSQYALFAFVFATAFGTLTGGPIGDKIGRKYVIWASILGATPFTLALPHFGLYGTIICSFGAGYTLSSAFPAIVLFAQELLPNRIGMISGLFFGIAFGFAGIAAAFWGNYAEHNGIEAMVSVAAYMPLLGIVAILLPKR